MADTQRLPIPLIQNYEWQRAAACRGMDSSVFFHPFKERNSDRRRRIADAKAICNHCPVIDACLTHALHSREPYGIWGGLSEDERAQLLGVQSLRYPAPIPDSSMNAARTEDLTAPSENGDRLRSASPNRWQAISSNLAPEAAIASAWTVLNRRDWLAHAND